MHGICEFWILGFDFGIIKTWYFVGRKKRKEEQHKLISIGKQAKCILKKLWAKVK